MLKLGCLERFGTDLPVAQGSEIIGPADPSVIYWHDTPVLISPIGGHIGGGKVRLSLFSIRLPAPRRDQSIS